MIMQFKGNYDFLSNFAPVMVHAWGEPYISVEHAYQASKTLVPIERARISVVTAGQAKRMGRQITMRPDWERVKVGVMLELLVEKFTQEPYKSRLLETGREELIEGNLWGDSFWGYDMKKRYGENILGSLIMGVRYLLNAGTPVRIDDKGWHYTTYPAGGHLFVFYSAAESSWVVDWL